MRFFVKREKNDSAGFFLIKSDDFLSEVAPKIKKYAKFNWVLAVKILLFESGTVRICGMMTQLMRQKRRISLVRQVEL